jgi:hypothetical protein
MNLKMKLTDLSTNVLDSFAKTVTDKVFQHIQTDRKLMKDYLLSVDENGLGVINRYLGKEIKRRFHLTNRDRQNNPKSTLIQSHQEF